MFQTRFTKDTHALLNYAKAIDSDKLRNIIQTNVTKIHLNHVFGYRDLPSVSEVLEPVLAVAVEKGNNLIKLESNENYNASLDSINNLDASHDLSNEIFTNSLSEKAETISFNTIINNYAPLVHSISAQIEDEVFDQVSIIPELLAEFDKLTTNAIELAIIRQFITVAETRLPELGYKVYSDLFTAGLYIEVPDTEDEESYDNEDNEEDDDLFFHDNNSID